MPEVKTKARAKWAAASKAKEGGGDDEENENEGDEEGGGTTEKPTVIVVDHEITPSQARNLERATGAQVLDRTGVIVDIFHRHARSREARIQVEIARLNYVAPRMRESGGGKERQRGKGAGEAAIELDRRKIRDRIAELREQLAAIQKEQENRRQARHDQLRVALVGYTNAGKSSLMRALTGSQVLVEDKLFATLDTTVRALQPETKPRILVSDTVGFIKKLPHDLVASFRSTLDEALEASLLLYVVDASDPTHEAQLEVTRSVLREIGAHVVPNLLLLNKADRLDAEARTSLLRRHRASQGEDKAIVLSAHDPADVAALRQTVVEFFEAKMVEEGGRRAVCQAGAPRGGVREREGHRRGIRRGGDAAEGSWAARGNRPVAASLESVRGATHGLGGRELTAAGLRAACGSPPSPRESRGWPRRVHRNPARARSCSRASCSRERTAPAL